jgi:hypothetical protein
MDGKISVIIMLTLLLMTGCQSNNKNEVVNEHSDIQNIERLNRFIEKVNKKKSDEINYIQYGIEGQRGETTLTFNGERINVSFSVDGDLIDEFNCKDIIIETSEKGQKYVLSECTGTIDDNYELLSVLNQ